MDFEFSSDTLMLRDMLRRFVQKEARPLEMKYFTAGVLAPEEKARLHRSIEQMGLWGLTAPEQFGGGGLDLVNCCVIQEELGQTFIPVEIGEVTPLLFSCSGEQVSGYLEPALAGERRAILAAREPGSCRPDNWTTHASVVEGGPSSGFRLNGNKVIGVQPDPADFFIVIANGHEQRFTAFLIDGDHPGLEVSANGEFTLALRDCEVGKEAVLGEPGGAFGLGVQEAPRAWIQTGARTVGIVQRLMEMAVEYARDWESLGAPLAIRPAIQRMIAEISVELESSRWLVYHAAWLADKGETDETRFQAAQVRLATAEMLKRAVDRVTMIYAGPGPSTQIEPQRLIRSVVPMDALELTLENARAAISTQVLGLQNLGGDS
ncbi:MAG TPA: acyl-CoA dehydrogenase family protein [Anaerolineales bacterium]